MEHLSPEFRIILDDFRRVRDAYTGLKTYSETQEAVLILEKERLAKMIEKLTKVSKTCLMLETKHKSVVKKMQKEKDDLNEVIAELKEQCDHLRQNIVQYNNEVADEHGRQLETEIEVLKSQLLLQNEQHNEELASLKQKCSDEVQKYKLLLQTANDPEEFSNRTAKRGRVNTTRTYKKNATQFKWPNLEVEKISCTPVEDCEDDSTVDANRKNKKRKLHYEAVDNVTHIG